MKYTKLPDLVDFVIGFCNVHGFVITPMKLQKILYYIQSWHISKFDKHSLFNELPEAWVNGPVYRSVYNQFKTTFFKSEQIFLKDKNFNEESLNKIQNRLSVEDEQLLIIKTITKHYSSFDESRLVMMTHSDSPWNEARNGLDDLARCEEKISIESMFAFYNPRIQQK